MTVTNNEFGQSNIWAKEPQMKVQEVTVTHNERAEMLNGRLAMLGEIAYSTELTIYHQLTLAGNAGAYVTVNITLNRKFRVALGYLTP